MNDAQEIEIEKNISIDIKVDYVECEECTDRLEFSLTTDSFGDIQILVKPCGCVKEVSDE